jgi:hypothetical protein
MPVPQRPMAAAVSADLHGDVRQSRLAGWRAALMRALRGSRRRQGERELSRYRHLICTDETHSELDILRRPCRSAKNSG